MKPSVTRKNNFYPYLLLFIQPIFMASNIIVARGGVEYVPPVSLAFWRWLTVFVILMPFWSSVLRETGVGEISILHFVLSPWRARGWSDSNVCFCAQSLAKQGLEQFQSLFLLSVLGETGVGAIAKYVSVLGPW